MSLLRVYGLTHLEEWKWDMWTTESLAIRETPRLEKAALVATMSVEVDAEPTTLTAAAAPIAVTAVDEFAAEDPLHNTVHQSDSVNATRGLEGTPVEEGTDKKLAVTENNLPYPTTKGEALASPESFHTTVTHLQDSHSQDLSATSKINVIMSSHIAPIQNHSSTLHGRSSSENIVLHDPQMHGPSVLTSSHPENTESFSPSHTRELRSQSTPALSIDHAASTHTDVSGSVSVSETLAPISESFRPLTTSIQLPPPVATPTGGESIYRTIMNRLTALETNHTLYMRYAEEQTAGMREMLRRLGEDLGRLEGMVSLYFLFFK